MHEGVGGVSSSFKQNSACGHLRICFLYFSMRTLKNSTYSNRLNRYIRGLHGQLGYSILGYSGTRVKKKPSEEKNRKVEMTLQLGLFQLFDIFPILSLGQSRTRVFCRRGVRNSGIFQIRVRVRVFGFGFGSGYGQFSQNCRVSNLVPVQARIIGLERIL